MTRYARLVCPRGLVRWAGPLAVFLTIAGTAAAGDWFVDDNGDCAGGDGSAGNPFCRIQDAIDVALDGDVVFVAPGRYVEHLIVDRDLSFVGSAGRDVTVVDGDASGRTMEILSGSTVDVLGVTFAFGFTRLDPGAGLAIWTGAEVTLRDVLFASHEAEPSCQYGEDCLEGDGGGLFVDEGAVATLIGCEVRDCIGGAGGGMFVSGQAVLESTTVSGCLGLGRGGGGIFNEGTLTVRGGSIVGNEVSGYSDFSSGGGIENEGVLLLDGVRLEGNDGEGDGGGLVNRSRAVATVLRSIVRGNEAIARGGGVFNEGTLTIEDSLISRNVLAESGNGAGLHHKGSFGTTLTRVTIAANEVQSGRWGSGGGVYAANPDIRLDHTIVAGNSAPFGPDIAYTVTSVGHCAVGDTTDSQYSGDESGNLYDVDPLFVDPDGPDDDPDTWQDNDWRLQIASPCVDAGDPALLLSHRDLGDSPRVLDGDLDRTMVIDMGAFEASNVHLTVTGQAIPGGTLLLDSSGTTGLRLLMLAGVATDEVILPPFGALYVALNPWLVLGWGTIPNQVIATIPPSVVPPLPIVLQLLALDVGTPSAGNLSNVVEFTIE